MTLRPRIGAGTHLNDGVKKVNGASRSVTRSNGLLIFDQYDLIFVQSLEKSNKFLEELDKYKVLLDRYLEILDGCHFVLPHFSVMASNKGWLLINI